MDDTTTPYSRALTAAGGARSGGKITHRRRSSAAKTPYDRPPPPPPENSRTNWLTGHVLPNTSRMIAKGAMKLFTFMTDTNSVSDDDDSDEDDVASCDDDDVPFKKDNTATEINNGEEPQLSGKSPKWVIEKLLLQETFSREESDKLIEIIKSRVVDCSTMEEGQGAGLMETPSRRYGDNIASWTYTPDRCSKAVMEAKYWLEEKKTGSSSKSDMLAQVDKGSPVDVAKSYMQARPPWASPSLRNSGSRTPSPMVIDLFKDEKLSSVDGSSFSSAQKRGTLSAGSWTIQDEIRKVRSKATEEMLRLPSSRIDISSFTSEHKKSQSSVVPDDSSDKAHVSKSLPEIEPVDASVDLVAGSSTIHDSKGSALGMKKDHLQAEQFSTIPDTSISEPNQDVNVKEGTTTDSHQSISLEHLAKQHDANDTNSKVENVSTNVNVSNSGPPNANGSASLRFSSLEGMDIEQLPKQPDNKPTTSIPADEVCAFSSEASLEIPLVNDIISPADGSQDLKDSGHQVDMKNGMPVPKGLNEKPQERKSSRNQRRVKGKGK
ncbi:uncharacterized protein LOC141671768 isoform X2 [Apium graveolens]|uniref:uncharacterized protein LOC141671768 isoform X2 n=1 Tax=Apium graveolens TaxID=4045 RepID=UPI003D79609E